MPGEGPCHRVVHLIGELGYGGTERQLFLLLKHGDHACFEHHVVVFNRSRHRDYRRALEDRGVRIWEIPEDIKAIWGRTRHLHDLFRQLQPAIVHSWTVHDNAYAGVVGRWAGVPLRWGSLRGSPDLPGFRRLPWPLRVLSLRGVQKLMVNADSIRQRLANDGLPPERLILLENCVELPEAASPVDLSGLGLEDSDRLVGTIGNLRSVKNHLLFVRAMAQALPSHPRVRALIVGQELPDEPELPQRIDAEIARCGLEGRVLRIGFRSDVLGVLTRLEVFCLTSESEGMPNTILEAMAAGKPVVATRVGGVPELVVEGETGLLADRGDVEGVATGVTRLLSDRHLAERLGRAGRDRVVARHRCSDAAGRLESLYRVALQASSRLAGRSSR